MRLSIITPVYNNARFIEGCIRNVKEQGCEVEHIIVDGGSTDGTVEIIQKQAELHSHLKWISEPDQGQSDAMNKGIRMATGDVISLLNVDDFYEPGVFKSVLEKLEGLSSPFFMVGNCNILNDDGDVVSVYKSVGLSRVSMIARYEIPPNPAGYFYSKELHDKVGEYDVSNHESMDLAFILAVSRQIDFTVFDEDWGNFRLIQGTKTYENMRSDEAVARSKALFDAELKRLSEEDQKEVHQIRGKLKRQNFGRLLKNPGALLKRVIKR